MGSAGPVRGGKGLSSDLENVCCQELGGLDSEHAESRGREYEVAEGRNY